MHGVYSRKYRKMYHRYTFTFSYVYSSFHSKPKTTNSCKGLRMFRAVHTPFLARCAVKSCITQMCRKPSVGNKNKITFTALVVNYKYELKS